MDNKLEIINSLKRYKAYTPEALGLLNEYIILGYPLRDINNMCGHLPIFKIIGMLMEDNENDPIYRSAITNYYKSLQINQRKCLIISDNHLGRLRKGEEVSEVLQNERGLFNAYMHAYNHGIFNIIHLGDLIEGNSFLGQPRIEIVKKQVEYLGNFYSQLPPIKTYLLYGNHDFNSIIYDGIGLDFYKCCYRMELIGLKLSYINFCGSTLKLFHECSQASAYKTMKLPSHVLELSGHSHTYDYWEEVRRLRVPSLSCASDFLSEIGFLEMIDEGDVLLFKFFDYNDIEKPEKEKVIKKELVFLPNSSNPNNL